MAQTKRPGESRRPHPTRHCELRNGAAIHPAAAWGWKEDGLPRLPRSLAMTVGVRLLSVRRRWRGFRHCEPRCGAAIHPAAAWGWKEDGLPRLLRSLAMTGFYAGEVAGEGFLEDGLL